MKLTNAINSMPSQLRCHHLASRHSHDCARLKSERGVCGSADGVALVEFALALPLFLIIIFGMIQYSLIIATKLCLSTASAEAARFSVLSPRPTTLQVQNYAVGLVQPYLDVAHLDTPSVTDVLVGGIAGGRQVQMVYHMPALFSGIFKSSNVFNLQATTIMR